MKLTLPNLNKAQLCSLSYINQYGDERCYAPEMPTFSVHNVNYDTTEKLINGCNAYDYAREHATIDIWTPLIRIEFSANKTLVVKGPRALKLWKAWQAVVYRKQQ